MDVKRSSRSGQYLHWRMQVERAYRAAGMDREADRWSTCSDPAHFFTPQPGENLPGESVGVVVCEDDPQHFTKNICPTCDYRTCPDCAHRHGSRLLSRYMPALQQHFENPRKDWQFKHIVLTTPLYLTETGLRDEIKALYGLVRVLFEELLKTAYKRPVDISEVGLILAHEFGENGRKLHFHVLYYGPWIYQSALSKQWRRLTGWPVAWIHGIGPGQEHETLESAVVEILKYTTKFWKRDRNGNVTFIPPYLIPVLHSVLQGTRRVRSWGLFYGSQEKQEPATCPDCGGKLLLLSPLEFDIYLQTGWLPDQAAIALSATADLLHLILADKSGKDPPLIISQPEPF